MLYNIIMMLRFLLMIWKQQTIFIIHKHLEIVLSSLLNNWSIQRNGLARLQQ